MDTSPPSASWTVRTPPPDVAHRPCESETTLGPGHDAVSRSFFSGSVEAGRQAPYGSADGVARRHGRFADFAFREAFSPVRHYVGTKTTRAGRVARALDPSHPSHMTDLLSDIETPSDAELISRVRGGDTAAYGELFSRHVQAATRLAKQLVRGPDEDDLVSEAFAKVLPVLQSGRGPDVSFRAYL